jgi:glucokinase
MTKELAIGVDVGGTNLRAGIVNGDGRILKRESIAVGDDKSAKAVVDIVCGQIAKLMSESPGQVKAVGVGVPGIVDFEKGIVHRSPNFPAWNDANIRDEISRRVGLPLAFDNDANMHALGEARFGAGRGHRNMVLLTLGTGIGGGLILDGAVFHGDNGFAGEVGHIVVEADGIECGCGGRGCLEQYAASRGFAVFAGRLAEAERREFLAAAGVNLHDLKPELVANLADKGNSTAVKLWEIYGSYLGVGIATLINVLGIETFVIGGGITRSWDRFITTARKNALAHTYRHHEGKLKILRAELGDDAGIVGAALEGLALL